LRGVEWRLHVRVIVVRTNAANTTPITPQPLPDYMPVAEQIDPAFFFPKAPGRIDSARRPSSWLVRRIK